MYTITTMEGASLSRRILIRLAEFVSPWVASHATGKKEADSIGNDAKPSFQRLIKALGGGRSSMIILCNLRAVTVFSYCFIQCDFCDENPRKYFSKKFFVL